MPENKKFLDLKGLGDYKKMSGRDVDAKLNNAINDVYGMANNAYIQAFRTDESSAYGMASTAITMAREAHNMANNAYWWAMGAHASSIMNTVNNLAGVVNNVSKVANNAYSQAFRTDSSSVYAVAYNARNIANNAYAKANNAYSQAFRTDSSSAYGIACNAYALASNAYWYVIGAKDSSVRNIAYNAYNQANNAWNKANDAYSLAYSAIYKANTAYDLAYSAYYRSDYRDKTDITLIEGNAIEFLRKVKAVRYVMNPRENYIEEEKLSEEDKEIIEKYDIYKYNKTEHSKGTKKGTRIHVGVIAQEVLTAMEEVYRDKNYADIVDDNLFNEKPEDIPDGVENKLRIAYPKFIPFLIKAIQELADRMDLIEERMYILENK